MIEKYETKSSFKIIKRTAAIVISCTAVCSGPVCAYALGNPIVVLLATGFLLFFSYILWITSSCGLEIGPGGIIIQVHGRRTFLAWSELGEFAPGNGVENNKVEFNLRGDKPLAEAYKGTAYLKLHTPRFLPDTFGMTAKELADLLNRKMKENSQQSAPANGETAVAEP
jgi:hypothetical protein